MCLVPGLGLSGVLNLRVCEGLTLWVSWRFQVNCALRSPLGFSALGL